MPADSGATAGSNDDPPPVPAPAPAPGPTPTAGLATAPVVSWWLLLPGCDGGAVGGGNVEAPVAVVVVVVVVEGAVLDEKNPAGIEAFPTGSRSHPSMHLTEIKKKTRKIITIKKRQ